MEVTSCLGFAKLPCECAPTRSRQTNRAALQQRGRLYYRNRMQQSCNGRIHNSGTVCQIKLFSGYVRSRTVSRRRSLFRTAFISPQVLTYLNVKRKPLSAVEGLETKEATYVQYTHTVASADADAKSRKVISTGGKREVETENQERGLEAVESETQRPHTAAGDKGYLPLARVEIIDITSAQEYAAGAVMSARVQGQKLAQEMQEKQQEIARVVQEKAIEVEQSLPPEAQGFIRESSGRVQQLTASVQAAVPAPLQPLLQKKFFLGIGLVIIFLKMVKRWRSEVAKDSVGSSNFNIPEKQRSPEEQAEWEKQQNENLRAPAEIPPMGSALDMLKKESVEWMNMVLRKVVKVYRRGIERWMVGLLQPLIDDLKKPSYVQRVKVKQFFLGDEPISVRSIERKTSRRATDLQYQIGLRYTGEARMLLEVPLKLGFLPLTIPVGVRDLDVDAEIWVKMQLIPCEPWIGTATWAFVTLPKIKLALAPFRLVNLMAIPFLSRFLEKLLTEDLPRLFVRPNKSVVDLLKGKKGRKGVAFKEGQSLFGNFGFAGELSLTLIAARRLPYFSYGTSDPYVVLTLGEQVVASKKNSETSTIGPPGAPLWNQDFQLLVVDPKSQRLTVRVRDALGVTYTVGYGEVPLSILQDTVPMDLNLPLRLGWGPAAQRSSGELKMRLTYKAYVEEDEFGDIVAKQTSLVPPPKETQIPPVFLEMANMASKLAKEADRAASLLDVPGVPKEVAEKILAQAKEMGENLRADMEKAMEGVGRSNGAAIGGGGRGSHEGGNGLRSLPFPSIRKGAEERKHVGKLENSEDGNGAMWSSGTENGGLKRNEGRNEGVNGEMKLRGGWQGLWAGLFDDGWDEVEDNSYQKVERGSGTEFNKNGSLAEGVREYGEALDLGKKVESINSPALREGALEKAKSTVLEGKGLEGVKDALKSNKFLEDAKEIVFSGDQVKVLDKGLAPINEATREGDAEGSRVVSVSSKEIERKGGLEGQAAAVATGLSTRSALIWLAIISAIVILVAFDMDITNPFNP